MTTQSLTKQQTKTRYRLMNAAIQLIQEEGFDTITITAIADRADYGRWAFYQYFTDKEDILYAIMTHWIASVTSAAVESVQAFDSPEREYRVWLAIFEKMVEQRLFVRQTGQAFAGSLRNRLTVFLIEDVSQYLESGKLSFSPNLSTELNSSMHIGAISEFVGRWIIGKDEVDLKQVTDDFFRFMFNQDPPQID